MANLTQGSPEQTLMRELGVTDHNIEMRKRAVGLAPEDLKRLATIRDVIVRNRDEYASRFFDYLSALEEAQPLFANREVVDRARRLKSEHLLAMVDGDYGSNYVEQRIKLGVLYGKVALEPRLFLGAYNHLLKSIGDAVMKRFREAPGEGFDIFMSLKKVAFFDIALIVDVLIFERERVIRKQQEAIRELSTPVLQLRERLLILPIIGVIDTYRARLLTESLLHAIRANRARVAVVDITGVAAVDSKVANHLLQAVAASKLMGATVIVTGLSSEVAQTLVTLGVDLSKLTTIGDLQGGIEEAERLLGYKVVPLSAQSNHSPEAQPGVE